MRSLTGSGKGSKVKARAGAPGGQEGSGRSWPMALVPLPQTHHLKVASGWKTLGLFSL